MIRTGGAVAILILPALLLSFLLALGERDWFHCFAHVDSTNIPPLPSIFDRGEFMPVLLETLTPPFSRPLLAVLHFGPTLIFAILFGLSRSNARRRMLLMVLGLFLIWVVWMLVPAASQHDCDRKGTDAMLALPMFILAGSIAALLANKISCMIGTCHDVPD
jgi:hypothetical protein